MEEKRMFVFREGRFSLIFLNMLPVYFQEPPSVGGGMQRVQRWDSEGREHSAGPRPQTFFALLCAKPGVGQVGSLQKAGGISVLGTWVGGEPLTEAGM